MFTALLSTADPNRLSFPKLGFELTVKSTAFTVFGLSVTWYGILITVGMMLAMIYAFRRMKQFGLDSDRAIDGIIGGVIGGIIGARAYYVAFHWSEYAGDWGKILNIRNGGLAIYGGIIGALLIGSVVCKLRKVRLLPMYDIISLGFLIGQGIGRWGNFTNHEAFGCNTDNIFGMTSGKISSWISQNITNGSVNPNQPVHPCFFYESMWCLLGFIVLHFISKKARKFDGQIFLMYIIWYGSGRFFIESLRTDSLYFGTVKVSQLVAVVSVVTAVILLLVGFSRTKRMGSDYKLYCDTEESKALLAETAAKEEAWQEKHNKKADDASETEMTHVLLADDDKKTEETKPEAEETGSGTETGSAEAEKTAEEIKAEKDAKIDALLDEIAAKPAADEQNDTEKKD